MDNYYLIDSCVWVDYFTGKRHREFLNQEIPLALSALSLFEVAKKLKKFNFPPKKIHYILNYLQKYSLILDTDSAVAISAAQFFHKLSAMDALIYTTAHVHNCTFVTQDSDFRDLPNVQFI